MANLIIFHYEDKWIWKIKQKDLIQATLHKKLSFSLKISSVNATKSAVSRGFADSVIFTEEIFNEKLQVLCSARKFSNMFSFIDDLAAISDSGELYKQKKPSRDVLRKRFSENMQQIYRRTPIPKCDFSKVALQLY